ncbi:hypothetical protein SO802_018512 [Lithocarpus litseifolius]|uniref:Uncharacterized protein n=1 Tax=Lithocarpus litseifolius TaxID=425828 RepID=A0AAW2CNX1_9ROSI
MEMWIMGLGMEMLNDSCLCSLSCSLLAKPKAKEIKNKPIPNYDKLVELYGRDRVTREQSKTESEMRQQWATLTGEGSLENIEDIDHLVAQSEVTMESCDNMDDNNVGETSSKAKKRKTSKNKDMEQIMGAIQDVALAGIFS